MSRSKHTDPRVLRAARRVRNPFERRGAKAGKHERGTRRQIKASGLETFEERKNRLERQFQPRIIVHQSSPGFHHPAGKKAIAEFLKKVGVEGYYGLKVVELRRSTPEPGKGKLTFGSYLAPGRICLYEQPISQWRLPWAIRNAAARQFQSAGAVVQSLRDAGATLVDWPGDTLERFMLEHVLLHELGHHVLQHHKGKRPIRIVRTKDHEAAASRFAARRLAALRDRRTPPI